MKVVLLSLNGNMQCINSVEIGLNYGTIKILVLCDFYFLLIKKYLREFVLHIQCVILHRSVR